jgi:DNA invertase Pin-like site-specific DNA recombinase
MAAQKTTDENAFHQDPDSTPHTLEARRRCAIYCRVSTCNKGHTTETQAMALRDYATQRGWPMAEYIDEGVSGAKDRRPGLDRLMRDAKARKFDLVIVARFDRFARSTSHLLRALDEFQQLGIDFVSLSENIDTGTAVGKMIFTVLSAVGELERNLIRERVAMGIRRARKQGRQLGRPRRIFDHDQARTLAQNGLSARAIAKQLGVSHTLIAQTIPTARNPSWMPRANYGTLHWQCVEKITLPKTFIYLGICTCIFLRFCPQVCRKDIPGIV